MRRKTQRQKIADFRKVLRKAQRQSTALVQATSIALRAVTTQRAALLIKDHEKKMLNACLYIALQTQDMNVLAEDFGATRTHVRKRIYARVLAVQCVTFFDDIPVLIRETVQSDAGLLASADGRALLTTARQLRPIRHKYEPLLRSIRNTAIAHRDREAIKQLESMTAIDIQKFFQLLSAVIRWRTELLTAFLPLIVRMTARPVIVTAHLEALNVKAKPR